MKLCVVEDDCRADVVSFLLAGNGMDRKNLSEIESEREGIPTTLLQGHRRFCRFKVVWIDDKWNTF